MLVLDTEGNRVLAKYYPQPKDASVPDSKFSSVKEQKAFEKGLWEKTKKPGGPFVLCRCAVEPLCRISLKTFRLFVLTHMETFSPILFLGDVILFDSHLALFKHSLDLIFYIIGPATENELMLAAALNTFSDALSMLLRNQVEKRSVLENLDMVLLCLDETIDDG